MAIYIARHVFSEGIASFPYLWTILKLSPWLLLLWLAKWFFSGAMNKSERKMHGKVAIVTVGGNFF